MTERITGHTELIGLMAYPIRHSSSPAMHNEAFATLGLDYAYLAFEVDNSTLEDAVKGLRALKMVGSNVSMPNKTVVGQYLDELSPAAQMCGAVNTIVNDNGKLIGHITDGIGYMQSLKDNNIDVIGKKLPEDDGEIVPQPPVEKEQVRPQQAQEPENGGRNHLLGLFRHNPLEQQAPREANLCQKTDDVYHILLLYPWNYLNTITL